MNDAADAGRAAAAAFLSAPGRDGAMGALMDEYARAAEEFCRVVESFDAVRWMSARGSAGVPAAAGSAHTVRVAGATDASSAAEAAGVDPHTRTPQAICAHVCGAARRYADDIRKARGLPFEERFGLATGQPAAPRDVRPLLREALHYTEGALAGLYDASEEQVFAIRFTVSWGANYDPDMLLEHAVMHLLRHRRQLQRWGP